MLEGQVENASNFFSEEQRSYILTKIDNPSIEIKFMTNFFKREIS